MQPIQPTLVSGQAVPRACLACKHCDEVSPAVAAVAAAAAAAMILFTKGNVTAFCEDLITALNQVVCHA